MDKIGFPTQGEFIKFVFDAAGILPTKRSTLENFDETRKKSIQTALKRLASEKGNLSDCFAGMVKTLSYFIAKDITNIRVLMTMGDVVADLLDVYAAVNKSDGTYLNKAKTVHWVTSQYAVYRLVLSVNKHLLRYNMASENLHSPEDPFWFLPTIDGDVVTWPIEKVLRWTYVECKTSQTHFHFPGKSSNNQDHTRQQNLDNASKWLSNKGVPSWPGLLWNVERSFEYMSTCKQPEYHRQIAERTQISIKLALFIARASTYVTQALHSQYGVSGLAAFCEQYRRYSTWIAEDVTDLKASVAEQLEKEPTVRPDEVWWKVSNHYWLWFADKADNFANHLHRLMVEAQDKPLSDKAISALITIYGPFTTRYGLEWLEKQDERQPPKDFAEQLFAGLDLKRQPNTTEEEINCYAKTLDDKALAHVIPWMEPWLRAIFHYRNRDFELALIFFRSALGHAKYCAGQYQRDLVNEYVELSAKVGSWKNFKQGVEWARYRGFEIECFGEQEVGGETLKEAFKRVRAAGAGGF